MTYRDKLVQQADMVENVPEVFCKTLHAADQVQFQTRHVEEVVLYIPVRI